jgi:hypothetical protein
MESELMTIMYDYLRSSSIHEISRFFIISIVAKMPYFTFLVSQILQWLNKHIEEMSRISIHDLIIGSSIRFISYQFWVLDTRNFVYTSFESLKSHRDILVFIMVRLSFIHYDETTKENSYRGNKR